jgi:hypothetical protein
MHGGSLESSPAIAGSLFSANRPHVAVGFNAGIPPVLRGTFLLRSDHVKRTGRCLHMSISNGRASKASLSNTRLSRTAEQACAWEHRLKDLQTTIARSRVNEATANLVPVNLILRLLYAISAKFLSILAFALRIVVFFLKSFNSDRNKDKQPMQRETPCEVADIKHSSGKDEIEAMQPSSSEDAELVHAAGMKNAKDSKSGMEISITVLAHGKSPFGGSDGRQNSPYLATVTMDELMATKYGGSLASKQGS